MLGPVRIFTKPSLTPSNVNALKFGKLFTIRLDGDVYAQPLYVPKIAVPSLGIHNIVYAATGNNTVYALDADDPKRSNSLECSPGTSPLI